MLNAWVGQVQLLGQYTSEDRCWARRAAVAAPRQHQGEPLLLVLDAAPVKVLVTGPVASIEPVAALPTGCQVCLTSALALAELQ